MFNAMVARFKTDVARKGILKCCIKTINKDIRRAIRNGNMESLSLIVYVDYDMTPVLDYYRSMGYLVKHVSNQRGDYSITISWEENNMKKI